MCAFLLFLCFKLSALAQPDELLYSPDNELLRGILISLGPSVRPTFHVGSVAPIVLDEFFTY